MSWQDVAKEFWDKHPGDHGSTKWPESTIIMEMAEEIVRLREKLDTVREALEFYANDRYQWREYAEKLRAALESLQDASADWLSATEEECNHNPEWQTLSAECENTHEALALKMPGEEK